MQQQWKKSPRKNQFRIFCFFLVALAVLGLVTIEQTVWAQTNNSLPPFAFITGMNWLGQETQLVQTTNGVHYQGADIFIGETAVFYVDIELSASANQTINVYAKETGSSGALTFSQSTSTDNGSNALFFVGQANVNPTETNKFPINVKNNGTKTELNGSIEVFLNVEDQTTASDSIDYTLIPTYRPYSPTNTTNPAPTLTPDLTTLPSISSPTSTPSTVDQTNWQLIIETIALLGFLVFLATIAAIYAKSKRIQQVPKKDS
jgi:hypothetical protein